MAKTAYTSPRESLGYDPQDLDPAHLPEDLRAIVTAEPNPDVPLGETYLLDMPDVGPGDQRAYSSAYLITAAQYELLSRFDASLALSNGPGWVEQEQPDYDPVAAQAANVLLELVYDHPEADLRPSELDQVAGSVYWPQC